MVPVPSGTIRLVAAPAAGLVSPGGVNAVFTPGLIAGAPGLMAGPPGVVTVPLLCGGRAVEVPPGVIAVRGAAGLGAPEPACANVAVELVTAKSEPL